MTNNDKAIDALDELYRFFDCLNPKQRAHRDSLVSTIRQALTPQSSADLGRVRELLQFSANGCLVPPDGGSPTIQDHIDTAKEALRILDEVIGRE